MWLVWLAVREAPKKKLVRCCVCKAHCNHYEAMNRLPSKMQGSVGGPGSVLGKALLLLHSGRLTNSTTSKVSLKPY
jgi:hypothetical protein